MLTNDNDPSYSLIILSRKFKLFISQEILYHRTTSLNSSIT